MSKLSNDIFNGKNHYISSTFGRRSIISASAGKTTSFHSGVDYATYGKKLTQYAVADGEILNCGSDIAYDGALFIWISYPSLGVKMLHYHLDSIKVEKGQKVKKGTALGTTGKTGKATGIHLHLSIKRLSGGEYIDAEKWSKEVYEKPKPEPYKVVTTTEVSCRTGANTAHKIVKIYKKDVTLDITETKNNWGKTSDGWICLDYTKEK